MSFAFLVLMNSEKDGIDGRVILGEALSVGDTATESSDLTLLWESPLGASVGPSTKGDGVAGGSVMGRALSDGEQLMVPRRLVKAVESAVDNHLTVLAT